MFLRFLCLVIFAANRFVVTPISAEQSSAMRYQNTRANKLELMSRNVSKLYTNYTLALIVNYTENSFDLFFCFIHFLNLEHKHNGP